MAGASVEIEAALAGGADNAAARALKASTDGPDAALWGKWAAAMAAGGSVEADIELFRYKCPQDVLSDGGTPSIARGRL